MDDPRGHVGTHMSTEARESKIQGPPQKSSLKVTQAGPRKGNSTVWDSISGRWIDVPVHPWPLRCDGSALRSGQRSRCGSAYLTKGHLISISLVTSGTKSSSRAALYRCSHRRSILLLCNNGSGPEIGLPGHICPDCSQECPGIGPSADLRPAGKAISVFSRYQSGQHLAKEADLLSGTIIA